MMLRLSGTVVGWAAIGAARLDDADARGAADKEMAAVLATGFGAWTPITGAGPPG